MDSLPPAAAAGNDSSRSPEGSCAPDLAPQRATQQLREAYLLASRLFEQAPLDLLR
jgi:hypothetical protein